MEIAQAACVTILKCDRTRPAGTRCGQALTSVREYPLTATGDSRLNDDKRHGRDRGAIDSTGRSHPTTARIRDPA